jgi:uncharacterized protein YjdB
MRTEHFRRASGVALLLWLCGCGAGSDATAPRIDPTAVESVYILPGAFTLSASEVRTVKATAFNQSGFVLPDRTFVWFTGDSSIVAVSDSGTLVGLAPGTATISAATGGKTGTANVTVLAATVSSVSMSPQTVTLVRGARALLTATAYDAANSPLSVVATWNSSAPSVATVSSTGAVTGVSEGTATIAATVKGVMGSARVVVTSVSVASIEVTPANVALRVGDVMLLNATPRATDGSALTGRVVTWSSSDPSIVQGFTDGDQAAITARSPGIATVTATSEGVTGTVTVVATAQTSNLCDQIAGAAVVANDGKYLGRLTNKFDSESIYNKFGTYGSQFSPLSINNEFGTYGSKFAPLSPFNAFTSTPPRLFRNGTALAYLTVNTLLTPYVAPAFAETCNFP